MTRARRLFFGLILALAGQASARELLSLAQAQALLFPQAARFEAHPIPLTPELKERLEKESETRVRLDEQKVWSALDAKGRALGWFLEDEVLAKHELFRYAAAIGLDGKLLRVEVLTYGETHGGQVQRREWLKQFEGKRAADRIALAHGIDGISGATLSCKHLTEGVRRLLLLYELVLKPQAGATQ